MAHECLDFGERPNTPPDIHKYRRAFNLEPGKRYQNPSMIGDSEILQLEKRTYGIKSVKNQADRLGVVDLLSKSGPKSLVDKLNIKKGEILSKTESPLGKSQKIKGTLPDNFNPDAYRGKPTMGEVDPVKRAMFPDADENEVAGEEIYKKSHAKYGPGEQKRRNYDWNINPDETRFGRKSDTIAFNGVSKGVSAVLAPDDLDETPMINTKAVEDYRDMGDLLGRSRNLGQGSGIKPYSYTYGRPSGLTSKSPAEWSVAETMRGTYSLREQSPDLDLGRSLTPGFRNITIENRSFGCPSIRSDLITNSKSRKSIADSQNYGNDPSARELISPAQFSDMAVKSDAFVSGRPREYLEKLFDDIGYTVPRNVSNIIFELAARGADVASIHEYRCVLNDYIVARETGMDEKWIEENS